MNTTNVKDNKRTLAFYFEVIALVSGSPALFLSVMGSQA